MEKYKCRPVSQGYRQIKRLHYTKTFCPTPAATSIRLVQATDAAENGELRYYVNIKQPFLQADIDKEIYIELYPHTIIPGVPVGAMGRLYKAIYSLV